MSFSSQIQRLPPSPALARQLQGSALERAERYAENGFWEDSLSLLVGLHCGPDRAASLAARQELFASVGLAYFNRIPLLEACERSED
ncbi:MAG: DUF928 domain-containing protein [Synechococcales cyanobacterium RM1_1_8]|nr:DUF928 domain-containing protein [Synechococcales cyanobacterium RM1_1_8]